MCLLKTAAQSPAVSMMNFKNRAVVFIASPIWIRNEEDPKRADLNEPVKWPYMEYIRDSIAARWQSVSFGVITSISAAMFAANCTSAVVLAASRARPLAPRSDTSCEIQAYVVKSKRVEDTIRQACERADLSAALKTMMIKLARRSGLVHFVFITDDDANSITPKPWWDYPPLDEDLAEVISDILPETFDEVSAALAGNPDTESFKTSLVRPTELVNAGMQMACDESYNSMWLYKLPALAAMRGLKPTRPNSYLE